VATDHCPFCFAGGKDAGKDDFSVIPNGGPGVEHRMSLVFDAAVATGRLSVHKWVDLMSTTPARLFGLAPRKGRVAVGADADLVIFDPDGQAVITARDSHSAADYSMYEGRAVRGTVQTVLRRGEVIVHAGRWQDAPPGGQYIKRGPSGVPA
jgi:dihydropyrimidinase